MNRLMFCVGVGALMGQGLAGKTVFAADFVPTADAPVSVADTATVLARAALWQRGARLLFAPSYDNPALRQWMFAASYSELSLSFCYDRQSEAYDPQLGDGSRVAAFDADAFIKSGSMTVWGSAAYRNGQQDNVLCNEASDAALVYPYFTTDEVGGDLATEQYAFAGGFGNMRGNWVWGGTLAYAAGLYYRDVDPRPRNVTGTLDASLGVAHRLCGDYYGGVSVSGRKYKQTDDVEFVSEMGSSILYHATGLGTHYSRFAGTGDAAYYDGYRYGATVNLYPRSGAGLIASAGFSRFTFDKVLTDLNHLPLCSVWHNAFTAQLGYAHHTDLHTAALALDYDFYRRHGKENIFGDATTSIYPKIGYLEMYADNSYGGTLTAIYEYHDAHRRLLSIQPAAGYSHRRQVYADPRREWLLNAVNARMDVRGAVAPSARCLLTLDAGYAYTKPLSSSQLVIIDAVANEASLIAVTQQAYANSAHDSQQCTATLSALRSLTERYAVQLSLSASSLRYYGGEHDDRLTAAVKFVF
jgi:hypothetical protein